MKRRSKHLIRANVRWDRFCESYSGLLKHVVGWYPSMHSRILIKLDDGRRLLYDYVNDSYVILDEDREYQDFEEDIFIKEFAQALDDKIFAKGLTYAEVARRIGVCPQAISAYVKGKAFPSMFNLVKLANVLGCSVAELVDYH